MRDIKKRELDHQVVQSQVEQERLQIAGNCMCPWADQQPLSARRKMTVALKWLQMAQCYTRVIDGLGVCVCVCVCVCVRVGRESHASQGQNSLHPIKQSRTRWSFTSTCPSKDSHTSTYPHTHTHTHTRTPRKGWKKKRISWPAPTVWKNINSLTRPRSDCSLALALSSFHSCLQLLWCSSLYSILNDLARSSIIGLEWKLIAKSLG